MSHGQSYYTAGELAKMFNLSKQTLLYYDRIGLLQPEFVSENGYRNYSLHQYLTLEVITNLRKLDISISAIQKYLENRSPEALRALLEKKDKKCQEIIEQNENVRKDIKSMFEQLDSLEETCLDQITLDYRHSKNLYISKISSGVGHMGTIYILANHNLTVFSEHHFKERSVGWIIDKESFLNETSGGAKAYFSSVSINYYDENEHYFETPVGFYVTLRFKGTFHKNKRKLAKKFSDFMKRNNLRPISDLYVQPLKNYWMCTSQNEYVNQISMQVEPMETDEDSFADDSEEQNNEK
ncbi:MerR family transcriptional regulator [Schwartzia sp. (in: firmicutes)]